MYIAQPVFMPDFQISNFVNSINSARSRKIFILLPKFLVEIDKYFLFVLLVKILKGH